MGAGGAGGATESSSPTDLPAPAAGDAPGLREVALPEHLVGRAPVPPAPPPDQEFLSARDLAGLLMVPVPTIHRMWRQTDIPGRLIGRELRFVRADVTRWISAGRGPAGTVAEEPADGLEE